MILVGNKSIKSTRSILFPVLLGLARFFRKPLDSDLHRQRGFSNRLAVSYSSLYSVEFFPDSTY